MYRSLFNQYFVGLAGYAIRQFQEPAVYRSYRIKFENLNSIMTIFFGVAIRPDTVE